MYKHLESCNTYSCLQFHLTKRTLEGFNAYNCNSTKKNTYIIPSTFEKLFKEYCNMEINVNNVKINVIKDFTYQIYLYYFYIYNLKIGDENATFYSWTLKE